MSIVNPETVQKNLASFFDDIRAFISQSLSSDKKLLRTLDKVEGQVQEVIQQWATREKDLYQELELASRIQQGTLPPFTDNWEGVRYTAYLSPMARVSGDFFDVIKSKSFYKLIVADVSGHGLPAALVTMAAKEVFHAPDISRLTPKEFFRKVNTEIYKRITTHDYLTAFALHFFDSQEFLYSNAGHQPAILLKGASKEFEFLEATGAFLGAIEDSSQLFSEARHKLYPGDRLFIFTDGLVEQRNGQDEIFGLDRLKNKLWEFWDYSGFELIQALVQEYDAFRGEVGLTDDVTLLVVELDSAYLETMQLVQEGKALLRKREYNEALAKGYQAHDKLPYLPETNYVVAVALYYMARYEEALPYFEEFFKKIQYRMRTVGVIYFDSLLRAGRDKKAFGFGKQLVNEKMPALFYRKLVGLAESMDNSQVAEMARDKLKQKGFAE